MNDRTTTLSDVCRIATEAGEWADQFDCIVKRGEGPNGNKPSKASCYDPANGKDARLAWFGGDLRDYEGKTIRIGGKGNKAKLYKGNVEISIGKNGTIAVIAEAPAGSAPAPSTTPPAGQNTPPPAQKQRVDPTTYFHREMQKLTLGYAHSYQYALDVQARIPKAMPPEQFQACVSSIFIEGNKHGIFAAVPKLRELDEKGVPFKYVPPVPDPAAVKAEEERKAAAAEAARKAREAEELARKAHNQPDAQENLDEDVPF